jgi:preprotein translocase subunit SecG
VNDAVFLINIVLIERGGGEGLLQIFEEQCSMSAELAVMMALKPETE